MSEVTRASGKARVVRHAKTRLLVVAGPDVGAQLEIAGQTALVGTASDNDLVLTDDTVSRKHCEIESTPAGIRVRDSGSTNGVLAGGIRLYDVLLSGPSTLWLGNTQISVIPLDETVDRLEATADRFGDVVGESARMRELFADLERIATSELALLIEGETGTGKDVIAESVHRASARAEGPFVVFDCGAVSPNLAESELFGHERGAFTGAVQARAGVFEEAHGGTLFLDEIGELPKDLQPKLLRVLEKGEVRRVGSNKVVRVDVRIIAATNRNMVAEVQNRAFREDLYFRLAATRVHVPPLRERMSDLPLLVGHFLSLETPPRRLEEVRPETWEMLHAHRWPGNVRELRNAVRRLLITPERAVDAMPRDAPSAAANPPESLRELLPLRLARRDAMDAFERGYVRAVLDRAGNNVSRAASVAEVSRQMLQKLMRKHAVAGGAAPARTSGAPLGAAAAAGPDGAAVPTRSKV
jgi:transcriptional regulator with PAS, ATPase and Fis domain